MITYDLSYLPDNWTAEKVLELFRKTGVLVTTNGYEIHLTESEKAEELLTKYDIYEQSIKRRLPPGKL